VVFGDFSPYVMVKRSTTSGPWLRRSGGMDAWTCPGSSLYLCPYYGWGRFPVEADFLTKQTESQPARHVVVAVPFSITEAVAFQTPAENA
jgi:hypothetical protein